MAHGTDRAILLGLSGQTPEGVDPTEIEAKLSAIRAAKKLELPGHHFIAFDEAKHLIFHRDQMYPVANIVSHPNGMRFSAFDNNGCFACRSGSSFRSAVASLSLTRSVLPRKPRTLQLDDQATRGSISFSQCRGTLEKAAAANITIPQLMLANECALVERGHASPEEEVRRGILHIWQVMRECTQHGIEAEGILPGGLKVRRRAAKLAARLRAGVSKDPLSQLDWITVYAMAVNEENAPGGGS